MLTDHISGDNIASVATQPLTGGEFITLTIAERAKSAIEQEFLIAWGQALALIQNNSDLINPSDIGRDTRTIGPGSSSDHPRLGPDTDAALKK